MGWATYHFNLDGNMASRYQLNTEKYSRKKIFSKTTQGKEVSNDYIYWLLLLTRFIQYY
jgi:hypothetical protein